MLDTEEVGRLETHPNPIKPYTTAEKPAESLAIPPEVLKGLSESYKLPATSDGKKYKPRSRVGLTLLAVGFVPKGTSDQEQPLLVAASPAWSKRASSMESSGRCFDRG